MSNIYHTIKNHSNAIFELLKTSEVKKIYNISIPHLALLLQFSEKPFVVIEDSAESALTLYNDLLFFNSVFRSALTKQHSAQIIYFPPSSSTELIGERAKALFKLKGILNGQRAYSPQQAAGSPACPADAGRSERIQNQLFLTLDSLKFTSGKIKMQKTLKNNISLITSKGAFQTGFSIFEIENDVLSIKRRMVMDREKLKGWLISYGYRDVSMIVEKGEYSQRGWLFDIYPVTEDYPVRVEFFGDEIDLIRIFEPSTQRSTREIDELSIFPAKEGELKSNLIGDLSKLCDIDIFVNSSNSELRALMGEPSSLPTVSYSLLPFVSEGVDSAELSLKGMGILPEERKGIEDIPRILTGIGKNTVAVLSSESQSERLKEIMFNGNYGLIAPIIERQDLKSYDGRLCITTGRLSSGINLPALLILTDREIFGERLPYRPIKKSKASRLLLSIDDMKPGDFVVHEYHGIGKFIELQRQKTTIDDKSYEEDFILLEYANGRVYIPFHNIQKLQRYSAGEGHIPYIDKLGGKGWHQTKQKVKTGIREMAEKLLRLYAERKIVRGFVFSEDTPMHREFDDFFPYEETPDQIKSVEEIKKHLYSEMPMDMLLSGDVGYGKTEVAMKAAFRAVYDGRQVAVLVPTTLLAEQHMRTFKMRFSGFPVKIDQISRFKNKEDMKRSITSISKGETDIVIGTHMLLSKKIQFHNIGLLIIDEEHRFGVAQKERLKELKRGVDVLMLTATPIPRTLHMSLSGIREMCTIETPPEERLAVKSIVTVFSDKTIKEAIEREIRRGGQAFFVHNRIRDIDKISTFIKGLIPDAKIAIAHGQMRGDELEKLMLAFINKETDVLVCTAIIGSGLDITTANTIIINRADTFGVSDLYQLKGRVGRGDVQAHAYFLMPGEDIITDDAKKRLQAIQEMSYLGAGFRLALKDLEIRGAGNLLGSEQSGHIHRVGFDMYMEMLEKAVAEIKGHEIKEEIDPQIRLMLSAFIPEDYIPDIALRLNIYRRISSVKSIDVLSELKHEILDRFGSMPDAMNNLIHVVKIKLLAKQLYISNVSDMEGRYRLSFISNQENKYKIPEDFFDKLLKTLFEMQKRGSGVRFLPDGFELDVHGLSSKEAIAKAEEMLQSLWAGNQNAKLVNTY